MDIYQQCPVTVLKHFTLRLICQEDAPHLFLCYHDPCAVALMNDDNCDFGFYAETPAQMTQTVSYWIDFYRQKCFVRFSIVDNQTNLAAGTIEGFGGETGVLRLDIASSYERADLLSELLSFVQSNFKMWFGNHTLVTKAAPFALERRRALEHCGWTYTGAFRGYPDYYSILL